MPGGFGGRLALRAVIRSPPFLGAAGEGVGFLLRIPSGYAPFLTPPQPEHKIPKNRREERGFAAKEDVMRGRDEFPFLALVVLSMATSTVWLAQTRSISTDDAPKAAGPYSQAVVAGGFLYAAGQVNRDPKTNQFATSSFEASAERVLDNLEAVLKADGLQWADVVKTTV